MTSVKMRGKWIAVNRQGKSNNDGSFLTMPDDSSAVGTIKFVGPDVKDPDLKVGTKVYFGKNHHLLKMLGSDVFVMTEDNIYSVVEDSNAKTQQPTSSAS